jgi:DNA polymerase elongation subunit (family B)
LEKVVAAEFQQGEAGHDSIVLFRRSDNEKVETSREHFRPFILVSDELLHELHGEHEAHELKGASGLNCKVCFPDWRSCLQAKSRLARSTGVSPSAPQAPFLFIPDPVQQYLMDSGITLFRGMSFDQLRRMQIDIECTTAEGFEFCNPEREEDRIIAVGMSDSTGWRQVLSGAELDEQTMLERMVQAIRDRDPDVIEGHNIFNFDLCYIMTRARRRGVRLAVGRDGSEPRTRPSRMNIAERAISYEKCEIFGRHIVDTLFLVHAYDVSNRSLDSFGLKEASQHFGLASENRTYIDGADIAGTFRSKPGEIMKYVLDDVLETGRLSALLSQSSFIQAKLLPYSYQNVCVRGNATKIDALMVREYLRQGQAVPVSSPARKFEGGYTDMFVRGVVRNVHHCDVRSLYPSLMLARRVAPGADQLGVFLQMLDRLKAIRMKAKERASSGGRGEREYWGAVQSAFKILINSFYGYLGFAQGHFNDYDAAARVTRMGRELLTSMIEWLKNHGARPVEIDTDGIYFVPPAVQAGRKCEEDIRAFHRAFQQWLPEGIEIEFDGEYQAMFSYKMKNYALLTRDGELIVKGGALKSRGLEPFQRDFLREALRLRLEGRDDELARLKSEYVTAIRERRWPLEKLAKTETLRDSPQSYKRKIDKGKRGRAAAYELALRSNREYRAGDQVSYYVSGTKKSAPVHESAKLVSDSVEGERDENVEYYLAKLEALCEKFVEIDRQEELGI